MTLVSFGFAGNVPTMQAAMNWTDVREELRKARLAAHLEERDLHEAGVCSLSNVYRIENIADNPTQKPDIETMERWLAATTGESIGMFLTRLAAPPAALSEKAPPVTSPVTVARDTVPVAPPPQPGEAASGHGTVISGFGVSAAQDAYLLKSLAFAIISAADALGRDGTLRSDDAGSPRRRGPTAGERGSDDAPDLSRVK